MATMVGTGRVGPAAARPAVLEWVGWVGMGEASCLAAGEGIGGRGVRGGEGGGSVGFAGNVGKGVGVGFGVDEGSGFGWLEGAKNVRAGTLG